MTTKKGDMTPEELKKKFEEAGFPSGTWQDPPKPEGGTVDMSNLSFFKEQRALMSKLSDLLEIQLKNDQEKVAQLYEKLHRLQHGGGS